jgi:hypothetical protein
MTSTTPLRMIAIALAALAITAPVAGAMPIRDNEGVQTSSLAGTPSAPTQDLRNPDQRAPAPEPKQDLRNPDNRVPAVPSDLPQTMKPVEIKQPVADDGPSPLVFILPGLAVVAMLGAAVIYTRSARPARV